jgi:multicomponent Na+:H+ antiporter subunit D
VPPLSGFLAKLAVIRAAAEAEAYILLGVALLIGLLTLLSMARVWQHMAWKPAPTDRPTGRLDSLVITPVAVLALLTVGLTFGAAPVFDMSTSAAELLLDPSSYVQAVLGDR